MAENSGIVVRIEDKIPECKKWLGDNILKRLDSAVKVWHRVLTEEVLTGSRSGRLYKVPGAKHRYYRASAPGEPPARRLGYLATSYATKVERYSGILGSHLNYARDLETGTSRIKPRKHIEPSFKRGKERILNELRRKFD